MMGVGGEGARENKGGREGGWEGEKERERERESATARAMERRRGAWRRR